MSSNTPHRVGTVLAGRYQLRESLGAGGLGQVFRAWDVQGQRAVAVKVFNPSRCGPDALDRYNKLIASAGRLGHPSVLLPRGMGLASKNPPIVVMDALVGDDAGNLRARLGRVPWPRALELAGQVAEVLHALYAATGVPHRDLKPTNVFITEKGEVRVLDYGIAEFDVQSQDSTRVDTALGVVDYKAPEQLEGAATDERTDVFSLGVLLYEMVTGVLPFQGPSYYEVARKILLGPAPRLAEVAPDAAIPLGVEALILRSLAKKPGERFADLQAMARAIAEVRRSPGVAPAAGPAATPSGTVIDPSAHAKSPGFEEDDPTTMLRPPTPVQRTTGPGVNALKNLTPVTVPPPEDRTVVSGNTGPRTFADAPRGGTLIDPNGGMGPLPQQPPPVGRTMPYGSQNAPRTVIDPNGAMGRPATVPPRTVIGPTTGAGLPPEDRTVVAGRTVVDTGQMAPSDRTMVLPDPTRQGGDPAADDSSTTMQFGRVHQKAESTMILPDGSDLSARPDSTMILSESKVQGRPGESTMILDDGAPRAETTMALDNAGAALSPGKKPAPPKPTGGAPDRSLQKTLILVNVVCGVLILVGIIVMLLAG